MALVTTGLEISALFHSKSITGIPRIIFELVKHAPEALVFFAGDKVVPEALAKRLLATPGGGPDLDAWLRDPGRRRVDALGLAHAVFPLWRLPRKLADVETSIICDITPILFPHFHKETGMAELFPRHVLAPLPYSDRIVCISEATRSDLAKHMPALAARMSVSHLGVDHLDVTPRPKTSTHRRFLMVGSLEPRKNVPLVLEWFLRSPAVKADDELRIAGGNGWDVDFAAEVRRFSAAHPARVQRIHRITTLDDAALRDEYREAFCLLYPSTYEGFGLPPLEAMAFGTPAVVARNSSLPEVCGDAAVYLDALDDWQRLDAAIATIERRLLASDFRSTLLARAAGFVWPDFAAAVYGGGQSATLLISPSPKGQP